MTAVPNPPRNDELFLPHEDPHRMDQPTLAWYVAGPVIGLMVPLHLILLNRTFGISSSFGTSAPPVPSKLDFLNYD